MKLFLHKDAKRVAITAANCCLLPACRNATFERRTENNLDKHAGSVACLSSWLSARTRYKRIQSRLVKSKPFCPSTYRLAVWQRSDSLDLELTTCDTAAW